MGFFSRIFSMLNLSSKDEIDPIDEMSIERLKADYFFKSFPDNLHGIFNKINISNVDIDYFYEHHFNDISFLKDFVENIETSENDKPISKRKPSINLEDKDGSGTADTTFHNMLYTIVDNENDKERLSFLMENYTQRDKFISGLYNNLLKNTEQLNFNNDKIKQVFKTIFNTIEKIAQLDKNNTSEKEKTVENQQISDDITNAFDEIKNIYVAIIEKGKMLDDNKDKAIFDLIIRDANLTISLLNLLNFMHETRTTPLPSGDNFVEFTPEMVEKNLFENFLKIIQKEKNIEKCKKFFSETKIDAALMKNKSKQDEQFFLKDFQKGILKAVISVYHKNSLSWPVKNYQKNYNEKTTGITVEFQDTSELLNQSKNNYNLLGEFITITKANFNSTVNNKTPKNIRESPKENFIQRDESESLSYIIKENLLLDHLIKVYSSDEYKEKAASFKDIEKEISALKAIFKTYAESYKKLPETAILTTLINELFSGMNTLSIDTKQLEEMKTAFISTLNLIFTSTTIEKNNEKVFSEDMLRKFVKEINLTEEVVKKKFLKGYEEILNNLFLQVYKEVIKKATTLEVKSQETVILYEKVLTDLFTLNAFFTVISNIFLLPDNNKSIEIKIANQELNLNNFMEGTNSKTIKQFTDEFNKKIDNSNDLLISQNMTLNEAIKYLGKAIFCSTKDKSNSENVLAYIQKDILNKFRASKALFEYAKKELLIFKTRSDILFEINENKAEMTSSSDANSENTTTSDENKAETIDNGNAIGVEKITSNETIDNGNAKDEKKNVSNENKEETTGNVKGVKQITSDETIDNGNAKDEKKNVSKENKEETTGNGNANSEKKIDSNENKEETTGNDNAKDEKKIDSNENDAAKNRRLLAIYRSMFEMYNVYSCFALYTISLNSNIEKLIKKYNIDTIKESTLNIKNADEKKEHLDRVEALGKFSIGLIFETEKKLEQSDETEFPDFILEEKNNFIYFMKSHEKAFKKNEVEITNAMNSFENFSDKLDYNVLDNEDEKMLNAKVKNFEKAKILLDLQYSIKQSLLNTGNFVLERYKTFFKKNSSLKDTILDFEKKIKEEEEKISNIDLKYKSKTKKLPEIINGIQERTKVITLRNDSIKNANALLDLVKTHFDALVLEKINRIDIKKPKFFKTFLDSLEKGGFNGFNSSLGIIILLILILLNCIQIAILIHKKSKRKENLNESKEEE